MKLSLQTKEQRNTYSVWYLVASMLEIPLLVMTIISMMYVHVIPSLLWGMMYVLTFMFRFGMAQYAIHGEDE